MAYEISLRLRDDLYERMMRLAARQNQPIEAAIIQQLDHSLALSDSKQFALDDDEAKDEIASFHALHPQLQREYLGEYVALHGGKVVDHDLDRIQLFARIEERFPNQFVLIRPVQKPVDREFYFRSPRLEPRTQ